MPSALLEYTLELWSTTLRQATQRIRPLFAAPSVAASVNAFLEGLLGGRVASPEMLPEGGALPHLICSPPQLGGGGSDEAGEHGNAR